MIPTTDQQLVPCSHKVLTYVYREQSSVSGVFRTIDPHPLSTQRVCPLPAGGYTLHTRRAVSGWGVNSSDDARHWIDLLQYNPSTRVVHFRYTI